MLPLPVTARLHVQPDIADALSDVAGALPTYDEAALYSPALQAKLREAFRGAASEGLEALLEEIRARLAAVPFAAYVTGLRFDDGNLLFVALTSAFGYVVDPYRQSWSKLVRYIRPSTDRVIDGIGILNEALHTDGTDWREPNDVTCLLCVRPDQKDGGRSRLIDETAVTALVRDQLSEDAADTLAREPVPWRIADELGGGVEWSPVLGAAGIRWLRFTLDGSLRPWMAPLVDALHELLADPADAIDFAMEPGGLLLVNNKRCLHARTGIPDPTRSERLVLRTKVLRDLTVCEPPPTWHY